jgi:hypothetical protein
MFVRSSMGTDTPENMQWQSREAAMAKDKVE